MAKGQNTKQSVSYRFQPAVVARLRQRAKQSGARQNDLVERYIEEGLRQEDHPVIYFRTGEAGRRAALLGTRLDVQDVITTLRQNDNVIEDTAEYLDVSPAVVQAALRYYAEYRDEVDELIAQAEAFAERERSLWERQQQALG